MPDIKWTTDSSQLSKSASSQLTLFTLKIFREYSIVLSIMKYFLCYFISETNSLVYVNFGRKKNITICHIFIYMYYVQGLYIYMAINLTINKHFFIASLTFFHFYLLFFLRDFIKKKKITSKSLILLWKNYYFIHNIFLKFMSYLSVCEMLFNCYCGWNFNATV